MPADRRTDLKPQHSHHHGVIRRTAVAAWTAAMLMAMACTAPLFAAAPPPATQPTKPIAKSSAKTAAEPMWADQVEPILRHNCFKCHGEVKQKGGLDLRRQDAIFQGGTDGSVIVPGRPADSPLYQKIQPGAEGHMPPDKDHQLSAQELVAIQDWIAALPPTSNHPPITGAGVDAGSTGPSLIDLATATHWQAPKGMQPAAVIDLLIEKHWTEQHATGGKVCDDRAFVRRLYLDLVGRIPTRTECEAFVASSDSNKRSVLIDQLLAGGEYATHMAEVFDVVLMERKAKGIEQERKARGWLAYLETAFASNEPWNQMVAELIVGRPQAPRQRGAVVFLYERKNNYQQMAEAIAPIAFGVQIGCAQCHNHPLAHEIKQQHYWGLVAGFNRTTNTDTKNGAGLSESAIGGFVTFTNLKKESQPAIITLLNGPTVAETRPAEGAKEKDDAGKYLVPPDKEKGRQVAVPKFSRRRAVADAVTNGNPLLARAMVNRMWAMLLGRGLVNPVDEMDSRHPPSHPELLAWLSEDFASGGYDIKRLIKSITLSRTYQLDSRWEAATPPAPELFARGLEKPLSAEVLWRSLLVATGNMTTPAIAANNPENSESQSLRQAMVVAFPSLFALEYNATLQQAMFLTNSPLVDGLLKPAGQNLTARLLQQMTNPDRVQTIFLELLGRAPDATELKSAVIYLESRSERPEAALRQLVWAVMTSAEFLMNH